MKTKRIRIVLVDDHAIVREGLRACLVPYRQVQVVGEAASGEEALIAVQPLKPDVVLMDIKLPQMSGLEATRRLRQQAPGSKVLVLSVYDNPEYVQESVRAGAQGYVLKNAAPQELVKAIAAIHGGTTYFSPGVAQVVMHDYVARENHTLPRVGLGLSLREREVLSLIAEGQGNKDIARRLKVGVRTIETHRERIMRKLDLHNVAALTKYAVARGLVKLT